MVESICGQDFAYAREVEEELAKELVKTRAKEATCKRLRRLEKLGQKPLSTTDLLATSFIVALADPVPREGFKNLTRPARHAAAEPSRSIRSNRGWLGERASTRSKSRDHEPAAPGERAAWRPALGRPSATSERARHSRRERPRCGPAGLMREQASRRAVVHAAGLVGQPMCPLPPFFSPFLFAFFFLVFWLNGLLN
jgi:hypothetical protein